MKKKNPERSFGEMNREIGSQWNSMTPEEKQVYRTGFNKCMEHVSISIQSRFQQVYGTGVQNRFQKRV